MSNELKKVVDFLESNTEYQYNDSIFCAGYDSLISHNKSIHLYYYDNENDYLMIIVGNPQEWVILKYNPTNSGIIVLNATYDNGILFKQYCDDLSTAIKIFNRCFENIMNEEDVLPYI